jgi:3-deoxy-manno-octulosonate cytidylyltransferase (CMP-KDO synthetase)
MSVLCVIPARLRSTRLPNKMLALLQGQPLIQKTYLAAKASPDIDRLVVATDSVEIKAIVEEVGGEVMMTPTDCQTGSDRVAHVAREYSDFNTVVNLQGDEPFIRKEMLATLIAPFHDKNPPKMATLAYDLIVDTEYHDPSLVKVICDMNNDAIYFSRSPIPYHRNPEAELKVLHHMGIYAYQRDFLLQYTQWPQTPLEKAELLEQLRAIEHGYKIRVCYTPYRTIEINTPEELEKAQRFGV